MIEFDEEKRRKNKAKHGIDLADAVRFDFDTAIEFDITEMAEDGEARIKTIGFVGLTLCAMIFTERGDAIRVISLRRATPKEARTFHDQS